VPDLLNGLLFLLQRLTWLDILDIVLVTVIFFVVLFVVRDTQATVLLRGMVFFIIMISLLTSLVDLPAFSWLVRTLLPTFFIAIPVIFAPEIRRGLEKLGRAGSTSIAWMPKTAQVQAVQQTINAIVTASIRLSDRKHGALIVLQRSDSLREYVRTGVYMDAKITPELLLQIFYPNTPLHDGAVIISDHRVLAGSCVLPLSASGILNRMPDRQMGLRHRASLGISEVSDAIAVVVSEENGAISIANNGRMVRRLDRERLENLLLAFYRPLQLQGSSFKTILRQVFNRSNPKQQDQ
jgi:diadenylate cyclase